MSSAPPLVPEELHPSIWRASQLARGSTRCVDTGHIALSKQLPGGGWPTGTMIDLLQQQPGIGELRLLGPALSKVADRMVALVCPPQVPQAISLHALGIPSSKILWVKPERTADMLWAAEQILRSGSVGAVLFWQNHMRGESQRRLHLAAGCGETLFFMFRPMAAAQDSSPAPLRLSLRPAAGGIDVGFVKRRGPSRDESLFIPLSVPGMSPARVVRNTPVVLPALESFAHAQSAVSS